MNYTPYAHLTDSELLREVANKTDASTLELELMLRLERATQLLEDLEEAPAATYKRYCD